MKETIKNYTVDEINAMIDFLDKLVVDVEDLSSQLQQAQDLNQRLLFQNFQLAMGLETAAGAPKEGTLH